MNSTRTARFLTCLGLCLALISIGVVAIIDRPLAPRQPVIFVAATGDTLVGAYYPGMRSGKIPRTCAA